MFKDIKLTDKKIFDHYWESEIMKNYIGHDLAFSNLYVHKTDYNIKILVEENILLIKGCYNGKVFFFPPMAFNIADFNKGIKLIREYFINYNLPFIIYGFTKDLLQYVDNINNNYIQTNFLEVEDALFNTNLDFKDEENIELQLKYSGKKHRVIHYHENNKKDVIQLYNTLREKNATNTDIDTILDTLDHLDKLTAFCNLFYVNKTLMGFYVGTVTKNSIGIMLIEEANNEIPEIYILITQQIINVFSKVNYISTYKKIRLQHPRSFTNGVSDYAIRTRLCLNEFEEIKDLYNSYYENIKEYQFFFNYDFFKKQYLINKENGLILSALFYRNQEISFNSNTISSIIIDNYISKKEVKSEDFKDFMLKLNTDLIILNIKDIDESYKRLSFINYQTNINPESIKKKYKSEFSTNIDTYSLLNLFSEYCNKFDIYMIRKYNNILELIKKHEYVDNKIYILRKSKNIVGYYIEDNNQKIIEYINLIDAPIVNESTSMFRILNVMNVLNKYKFNTDSDYTFTIKITDDLYKHNNLTLKIECKNKIVNISNSITYEYQYTIEELTKLLFVGNKDFEVNKFTKLFKNKIICSYFI